MKTEEEIRKIRAASHLKLRKINEEADTLEGAPHSEYLEDEERFTKFKINLLDYILGDLEDKHNEKS